MVRLLRCFGLSQPCSAPLQIVAHTQFHAIRILAAIHYHGSDKRSISSTIQAQVCSKLRQELSSQASEDVQTRLREIFYAFHSTTFSCNWNTPKEGVPSQLHAAAQLHAEAASHRLQAVFRTVQHLFANDDKYSWDHWWSA